MIRIHLSRLLGVRKEKIADLQRGTGLARNTLAGLYREDIARIDLATLDAICRHYKCSVADLLEYIPDGEIIVAPNSNAQ
jgi:putative transcriptional regulator